MKRILMLLILLPGLPCFAGDAKPEDLKAEFKQFYEQNLAPESWYQAEEQLKSSDSAVQKAAVAKLLTLVKQLKSDEADGTSPWLASPFWGSSGENPARNFRTYLLQDLIKAPAAPSCLPLIRWYLFEESLPNLQTDAMQALKPIDGEAANALRLEIIKGRPANSWVLAAALEQARERKLSLDPAVLTELAGHYRASIRKPAMKHLAAADKPAPKYDAAKAVQSEPARKIVERLIALWPDVPPADAKTLNYFQSFRYDDGTISEIGPHFGWVLSETNKELQFITLDCQFYSSDQSTRDKKPAKRGESTWRTEPAGVEKYVNEIAALRKDGDPEHELSSQGGLTGQFEGSGPTLKELLLGIWLYRAGQFDQAARLLLPAIDAAACDADVVELARHRLAIVYGQRMLGEFAYDRNMAETLRLARLYKEKYPKTIYSRDIEPMVLELPRRMDDFKTFKLPTPKEWSALKAKLKREEQIEYLCQRLRLLNCFQNGQPGGVSYYDSQYAESGWRAHDDPKSTPVINPLTELAGDPGGGWPERKPTDGLKLTLADVPALAANLKDYWTMVMYSYWRDFHPSRTFHHTRKVIAGEINELAKQNICRIDDMEKMSPQEIGKHIEMISAWARAHVGKPEADLHVEALERAVRENGWWYYQAEENGKALAALKDSRVVPLVLQIFERKEYRQRREGDFKAFMSILENFKPDAYTDFAIKMLDSQHDRGRLIAAYVLLSAGKFAPAANRLEAMLADEKFRMSTDDSVALVGLLATSQSDQSAKLLKKFIAANRLLNPVDPYGGGSLRVKTARWIYNGKCRDDLLHFYDAMLDDVHREKYSNREERQNRDAFAEEIIQLFREGDPALTALWENNKGTREKIPDLKKWIAAKLAEKK